MSRYEPPTDEALKGAYILGGPAAIACEARALRDKLKALIDAHRGDHAVAGQGCEECSIIECPHNSPLHLQGGVCRECDY